MPDFGTLDEAWQVEDQDGNDLGDFRERTLQDDIGWLHRRLVEAEKNIAMMREVEDPQMPPEEPIGEFVVGDEKDVFEQYSGLVLDGDNPDPYALSDYPYRRTIELNPIALPLVHYHETQIANADTVSIAAINTSQPQVGIPGMKVDAQGNGSVSWYYPDKHEGGIDQGTYHSLDFDNATNPRRGEIEGFKAGTATTNIAATDGFMVRTAIGGGQFAVRYADTGTVYDGLEADVIETINVVADTRAVHHLTEPWGAYDDHGVRDATNPYNYMLLGVDLGIASGRASKYERNTGQAILNVMSDSQSYIGRKLYIEDMLLVDGVNGTDSANDTGKGVGQFHGGISTKTPSYMTRGATGAQALKCQAGAADTRIVRLGVNDTYAGYAQRGAVRFGMAGSTYAAFGAGPFNTDSAYYVDGTQVLKHQQAAIADLGDTGTDIDGNLRGAFNTLLSELRAHGIIAT